MPFKAMAQVQRLACRPGSASHVTVAIVKYKVPRRPSSNIAPKIRRPRELAGKKDTVESWKCQVMWLPGPASWK